MRPPLLLIVGILMAAPVAAQTGGTLGLSDYTISGQDFGAPAAPALFIGFCVLMILSRSLDRDDLALARRIAARKEAKGAGEGEGTP